MKRESMKMHLDHNTTTPHYDDLAGAGRFRLTDFGLALCTSSYAFVVLAPRRLVWPIS